MCPSDTTISFHLLLLIVFLRVIMLSVPLNYDYPDQYWQGPQIAYKIYQKFINGQKIGYQTWQWTLEEPIRNPIYQFLLALGYMGAQGVVWVIDWVQQNQGSLLFYGQKQFDTMMQLGPKIIQAFLAIIGDIYIVKLFYFYFGKQQTSTFLILFIISNWFYLTMLSRTYINSFECILISVSFYHWQMYFGQNQIKIKQKQKQKQKILVCSRDDFISRILVLVAYVARPTSLIPWMIIWPAEVIYVAYQGYLIRDNHKQYDNVWSLERMKSIYHLLDIPLIKKLLFKNLFQIFMMILCSLLVGSVYFNKFTFTEWNFFYYNLVLKWSSLFDVHSWHFYFTCSLPVMLAGMLVFFVVGLYNGLWEDNKEEINGNDGKKAEFRRLCWMTVLFLVFITLVSGHKEHRFLLVFMPFILVITFKGFLKAKSILWNTSQKSCLKKSIFVTLIFIINCFNIWMIYSVALHPKGGFDLLRKIRNDIDTKNETGQFSFEKPHKIGVIYLCEPHALPGYSMILRDVALLLPDQSPIAKLSNRSQTALLTKHPQQLYDILVQRFSSISQKAKQNDIGYAILQQKFCQHEQISNLQKKKKHEMPRFQIVIEKKCKFIEENFQLTFISNNRNIWQTQIFGPDFLYLYTRKSKK